MKRRPKMSVIIAAAGSGRRMGGVSKAFLRLGRRSVLSYSLQTFAALPETAEIILVVSRSDIAARSAYLARIKRRYGIAHVVPGGKLRQESVANGLACVSPDADLVAVHDAARPLVSADLIRRVIRAAIKTGAAVPAAPVRDTLKRSGRNMLIAETVPRDGLWHVQTPQIFDAHLLKQAFKRYAHRGEFTDDAQLVERTGGKVALVESDQANIKLTTAEDLVVARALLKSATKRV